MAGCVIVAYNLGSWPDAVALIFVNYRKSDLGETAKLLSKRLRDFDYSVYLDEEANRETEEFPDRIRNNLEKCDLVLALIGPRWMEAKDEIGTPRIQQGPDWVRREIRSGLDRKCLFSVLVDGAKMPRPDDLPEDIRSLSSLPAYSRLTTSLEEVPDLCHRIDIVLAEIGNRAAFTGGVIAIGGALIAWAGRLAWRTLTGAGLKEHQEHMQGLRGLLEGSWRSSKPNRDSIKINVTELGGIVVQVWNAAGLWAEGTGEPSVMFVKYPGGKRPTVNLRFTIFGDETVVAQGPGKLTYVSGRTHSLELVYPGRRGEKLSIRLTERSREV
jgi:hypothetical protein